MKIFTHCPICNDPLLNIIEGQFIDKTCTNKLNHKFSLSASHEGELLNYSLEISPGSVLIWFFGQQQLLCCNCIFNKRFKKSKHEFTLPFFKPDFSDYPKLIAKIKSCILLS